MVSTPITDTVRDSGVKEKLLLLSTFIPILGATISATAPVFQLSKTDIFMSSIYLYMISLSAYLWHRDLEYGVLDYVETSAARSSAASGKIDFTRDNIRNKIDSIKQDLNIRLDSLDQDLSHMKGEVSLSSTVDIDKWYVLYKNRISSADKNIWITQNSEQSPESLGHPEYKEAFQELRKKGIESNVDVRWMISVPSDKKIYWLLTVLEELHNQDNVSIAVPELEEDLRNHEIPFVQSFQIVDDTVFGFDMSYGKREIESGTGKGDHFLTEDGDILSQILGHLDTWWDYSTKINNRKYINLCKVIYICQKYSENTESVLGELEETFDKIIGESEITWDDEIDDVITRIIEDEEHSYEAENIKITINKLIKNKSRRQELIDKVDKNTPDETD